MVATVRKMTGSPQFKEAPSELAPTSHAEIDEALAGLHSKKQEWANLPVEDVINFLEELRKTLYAEMPATVASGLIAKRIKKNTYHEGVEWGEYATSFYLIKRLLQMNFGIVLGREALRPNPNSLHVRDPGHLAALGPFYEPGSTAKNRNGTRRHPVGLSPAGENRELLL